eukprot:6289971-Heterocapsa_arctica.AAC.1
MYGGHPAGAQTKGRPMNPGPPPLPQQPAQSSATTWYVGQWIPTAWKDGVVTSWRQVQPGDIQPWDNR